MAAVLTCAQSRFLLGVVLTITCCGTIVCANCCMAGNCESCAGMTPSTHICGTSFEQCMGCGGTYCPNKSATEQLGPSARQTAGNQCCYYSTSKSDVCGTCQSFSSGSEWCASTEQRCKSNCGGTWCAQSGSSATPSPSPPPSADNSCCFYALKSTDICGTCQQAATGQEWCASTQDRCVTSCSGTWCAGGATIPTTSPPTQATTTKTLSTTTTAGPSTAASTTLKSTAATATTTQSQTTLGGTWIEGTYVTGYWDCCKPSCSWPGKGSVSAPVKACRPDGSQAHPLDVSVCLGGVSASCSNNQPWQASQTLSYGFAAAAVSGSHGLTGDSNCGQCFELRFTPQIHPNGNWGGAHPDLAGKRHIIQVTNIGYDVSGDHSFDLQIPGAGQGIFSSGCALQFPGKSIGDFDCDNRYGGCNDISGCSRLPAVLQPGCAWRYNFFKWLVQNGKTNNPYVRFRRVRCPQALTSITGAIPLDDDQYPIV